jgi:hypothetical protein
MAQGRRITDWQVETIRLAYAESGSISYAAIAAGVAFNTAKSYITEKRDELSKLRNEKKADVIAQVALVRIRILEEMHGTTRLSKSSLGELTMAFGILTDKHQLLTGEVTNRTENVNGDSPRDAFARRIDELAERRRSRVADFESDGPASEGVAP